MLGELEWGFAVADVRDEVLMAYVDGELDQATSAKVAGAIAEDAALMERVEIYRMTRAPVQQTFDRVLREPIPRHLIDLVRGNASAGQRPGSAPRGSVTPFARQMPRQRGGSLSTSTYLRMAASVAFLALAGAGGWLLHPLIGSGPIGSQTIARESAPTWAVALQSALETASSGTSVSVANQDRAAGSVKVVSTFHSRDQRYCRQFSMDLDRSGTFDGVACRAAGSEWLVEHQMRRTSELESRPGLRPAAGRVRQALDATVDELIDGGVLDPVEEQRVLDSRWTVVPQKQ